MLEAMGAPGSTFRTVWVSDRHLRVTAEDSVDLPPTWAAAAAERLWKSPAPGMLDAVPALRSLVVEFDLEQAAPERDEASWVLSNCLLGAQDAVVGGSNVVELPVSFAAPHAPDLESVAAERRLTTAQARQLLVDCPLIVAFIGFAPGFPYMVGVPKPLRVPRMNSPRARVPAGSVAISGEMCGIYPHATPGGWRVVGRTPLPLFDAMRDPPCTLRAGDRVRLREIDAADFEQLAGAPGGLQERP